MQQFQPDSAPDTGNSDEQPLVIEDLPVEAAQNQTTTSRKYKWQQNLPSLIASRFQPARTTPASVLQRTGWHVAC